MRDVRGHIHGRDKARMAAVFAALSELPGYEVTGEYTDWGWQVRYVCPVSSPGESWAVVGRALAVAQRAHGSRTAAIRLEM